LKLPSPYLEKAEELLSEEVSAEDFSEKE